MKISINGFIQKVTPADVLAAIVIIGGLVLMGMGINGTVGTLLVGITAYYWGHKRQT